MWSFLKLFPGIQGECGGYHSKIEGLKAVVGRCWFETYGSGNAPYGRNGSSACSARPVHGGIIIANVTQCSAGTDLEMGNVTKPDISCCRQGRLRYDSTKGESACYQINVFLNWTRLYAEWTRSMHDRDEPFNGGRNNSDKFV